MPDVLDRLNDPQNDTPPCSVNRAGHSPGWLDRGETCSYCGETPRPRKRDPFVPISEPTTGRDVVRALKAVENSTDEQLESYRGKPWDWLIACDEYVRKVLREMERLRNADADRTAERFARALQGEETP